MTKNKLVTIAAFALLSIIAMLLVINLPGFSLPTSSNISGLIPNSRPKVGDDGLLFISAHANLTQVSGGPQHVRSNITTNFAIANANPQIPLAGVHVTVTSAQNQAFQMNNVTNSLGQIADNLPPGTYKVVFVDWRFNDTSIAVDIRPSQVTSLNSLIEVTAYQVTSFLIQDPFSSGTAVAWEPIYLQIPTSEPVPSRDASVYVQTENITPHDTITSSTQLGLVHILITSNLTTANSDWLNVKIGSQFSIQSIKAIQLISINATFEVAS